MNLRCGGVTSPALTSREITSPVITSHCYLHTASLGVFTSHYYKLLIGNSEVNGQLMLGAKYFPAR
jgi:hypothetical protein